MIHKLFTALQHLSNSIVRGVIFHPVAVTNFRSDLISLRATIFYMSGHVVELLVYQSGSSYPKGLHNLFYTFKATFLGSVRSILAAGTHSRLGICEVGAAAE